MSDTFDDLDGSDKFPQLGKDGEYISLNTYQGIVSINIEICLNIVKEDVSKVRAGRCGYCGERSQIKSFTKEDKDHIFIYLCDDCYPSVKKDVQELIEDNSSGLIINNI